MCVLDSHSGSGTQTHHKDALAPRKIPGGPILVGSSSSATSQGEVS